jgi:outer membrane immunogenic protein
MKALLFAGLAVSALVTPAIAADAAFPPQAYPPHADMALPSPLVLWGWSGFHVGVNAGWGESAANAVNNSGTGIFAAAIPAGQIPASINLAQGGFLGGGQVGYDWQVGPSWVLGMEGDFDGGAGTKNSAGAAGKTIAPFSTTYARELDTLGTFRGRLGYLMAPDQLWYVTGGLAFGQTKIGSAFICATCVPASQSQTGTALETSVASTGWTVGTGFEWKFAPAWSIKVEYLFVDLGDRSNTINYTSAGVTNILTSTINERDNIVRFGLNYKLF